MSKNNIRYWICQVIGWGAWTLLNVFFVYFFAHDTYLASPEKRAVFFGAMFIEFVWAILATHLLRVGLKRIQWIRLPTGKIIIVFIAGLILTVLLDYYGARTTAVATNSSLVEFEKKEDLQRANDKENQLNVAGTNYYLLSKLAINDSTELKAVETIKQSTGWYRNKNGNWTYEDQHKGRFWWDIIFSFILIALWLLLYMVWHFVEKNRKDQVDKLTLEKTVKDLELKTIKSHINPHFIFNSLNSIRALVDENPQRARTAITELSNILRSSMQVEKMETVPLYKELDIVKDYMALEQMRFEERLKIELNIDEDTLNQPVAPMMLQTLVENAIKHGISKHINGGFVKVISVFKNGNHELIVQNSGHLNGEINKNGFGIKSAQDRLRYLYQGKASFEIKDIEGNIVQSKIIMPVDY
jgi:two-component system LytT family sensor kinase